MSFSKASLRSTIGACWFGVACIAGAAIDLTPEVNEYTAEGLKFQQLMFRENKQRIEYEPPQKWVFDGGANALHLKPPNKNFAEAVIEIATLSKPQSLDETVRNALKERFLASVPAGSQFVKLEQEIESPILLNGMPTFEMTVSYQLMGEKFCRSALFAIVRENEITFRCSARKDDFDRVHQEFRGSLLSWHWLEASDQAAPPSSTSSAPSAQ
jgi:hypothetical protein